MTAVDSRLVELSIGEDLQGSTDGSSYIGRDPVKNIGIQLYMYGTSYFYM